MSAVFGRITGYSSAALTAAMLFAQAANAQDAGSVTDYRLPDPKQSQAPRVQGPVDPDNPYSTPTRTPQPERTATPTPIPSASSAPRITLPAPTREEPRPAPRASAPPPEPRASPEPRSRDAAPTPSPSASPSAASPSPSPVTAAQTEPDTAPVATSTDDAPLVPPPVAEATPDRTWWIVGAVVLLVLAGGGLLFRRRRPEAMQIEEEEAAAAPVAEPVPLRPRPVPAPAPVATTPPAPAPRTVPSTGEPFALSAQFRPQAIRLSLVYATLQYELELANMSTEPLPPLIVRGDLSSAHASIPTAEQLAPPLEALEIKHEVAVLAPGESTVLKGEVRVPIQQIRPLVKGNASFLVPLARFCFAAPDGTFVRRVFTLGPRDAGSGAIASVRLDAGPRNLRELDAREIEAARGFALDPVAAHG